MEPVLWGLTLIDLAVIGGVALVLPTCLGGRWRWWALAAATATASCLSPTGSTAALLLALGWAAVVATLGIRRMIGLARDHQPLGTMVLALLPYGYAGVAALWFALSRSARTMFDVREPIVELTAIHFTYAGVGALVVAEVGRRRCTTRRSHRLATLGVALTAAAPPVVALGFVTHTAAGQVGGAVLMTLGVYAIALVQLDHAWRDRSLDSASRVLLALSGLAVWAPMALAVAWATAQYIDVPALSIPDMVRTHGSINAVGFIGLGLLARRHDLPPRTDLDEPHGTAGPARTTTSDDRVPAWS